MYRTLVLPSELLRCCIYESQSIACWSRHYSWWLLCLNLTFSFSKCFTEDVFAYMSWCYESCKSSFLSFAFAITVFNIASYESPFNLATDFIGLILFSLVEHLNIYISHTLCNVSCCSCSADGTIIFPAIYLPSMTAAICSFFIA